VVRAYGLDSLVELLGLVLGSQFPCQSDIASRILLGPALSYLVPNKYLYLCPTLLSSLNTMSETVIREVHTHTHSFTTLDAPFRLHETCGFSQGSTESALRHSVTQLRFCHRPFARIGLMTFGGRSTAIKMKDGGVWLLASTPLDEETKTTLNNLGPVRSAFVSCHSS